MDIGALVEAQKNSAKNKALQSNQLVQQGYILLAKAEEEGFKNKFLLKRAAKIFINNISTEKTNIDAYLGLAYIFLLVSNYDKAEYYLNEAREIQPEHPDVSQLLAYAQSQGAEKTNIASPGSHHRLSEEEFDNLYDSVELTIYTHLRTIIAAPVLQITLNSEEISNLNQQSKDLEAAYGSLKENLAILDIEFDIKDLYQKIRPIELQIKKYQKVIKVSQIFCNIQTAIKNHFQTVCQLLIQVESGQIDELEQHIEPLLDACAQFTEQLSYLDHKGYNIESLQSNHRELLNCVEQLQQAVEDKS